MTDEVRVLVTGPRYYPNVARVREAAGDVEAVYAGRRLILVHGRCDPRHPRSRDLIPWDAAEEFTLARRLELLGGDWLMAQIAADHGWALEPHAADWSRGKRAGPERNKHMVELGASVAIILTDLCAIPGCRRQSGTHISHGTAGCATLAEEAGMKTWRYPA
jgi:hypothetical protein